MGPAQVAWLGQAHWLYPLEVMHIRKLPFGVGSGGSPAFHIQP